VRGISDGRAIVDSDTAQIKSLSRGRANVTDGSIGLALRMANGVGTVAHFVAAVAITWLVVLTYRWMARRSLILCRLFAAGVIVRAAGGIALFLISFFGWPLFRSLQMGGGFWTLALDSRLYYDIASNAALHGLSSISDISPSPLYLRILAVWMWIFGLAPASALLLNVAAYAASAALVIVTADVQGRVEARDIRGAIVALAALTFSPALLIYSTQPLKDPLCLLFIISAISGARLLWPARSRLQNHGAQSVAAGMSLMAIGVYGLAGIRPYVCLFVLAGVVAATAHSVITSASFKRRLRDTLQGGALVALLWVAFVAGAGSYAWPYESAILSLVGSPGIPLSALDSARAGFASSGGATALAGLDETVGGTFAQSGGGRIGRLLRGLAVFFVPVTALAAASIVRFTGGQGLLGITDLDTVAIDCTLIVTIALLLLAPKRDPPSSALIFALVLGVLLTAAMAYVVTNYGTLFRLRIMAVTPFWLAPTLFASHRQDRATELPVLSPSRRSSQTSPPRQ